MADRHRPGTIDGSRIDRRTFLKAALAAGFAPSCLAEAVAAPPQTLYNGIELVRPWPPLRNPRTIDQPFEPPYLRHPPAVIPIDLGRQLFVDDFLIEDCSLARQSHRAVYHPRSPVMSPTEPWEREGDARFGPIPRTAMPFSDAVLFDPADGLFKMWYQASYAGRTAYAVSDDGFDWRKPELDVIPGTNLVLELPRDSSTVWLDHAATDPDRRFKLAIYSGRDRRVRRFLSADGQHWQDIGLTGPSGDRTTFFYNPFRRVWVFSIRDDDLRNEAGTKIAGRYRRYWETREFERPSTWNEGGPALWAAADRLDLQRPDFHVMPELYNLDCVAYESILLGLFTMFRGEGPRRHKVNDICVAYSRDGFHWARPWREPFIPVSEHPGVWNWTNVQSAGGCCLVRDDQLHFYVSGRSGIPGTDSPGTCSVGIATLRRDGFVSLNGSADPGSPVQTVTTRPVRFSGRHLFVNANMAGGELRVEVLDARGSIIQPFTAANCVPVARNATRIAVRWSGRASLAPLVGEAVRFRFSLTGGRLYSFWVSRSPQGASRGYVGGGGPGFSGPLDA